MIQTMGVILVIITALFALVTLSSKFIHALASKGAEKAARLFCKENNLEFIKMHELQNQYMLYYQKDGELYSSRFHFDSDGVIIWIKSVI
jgi:hypothetical protein